MVKMGFLELVATLFLASAASAQGVFIQPLVVEPISATGCTDDSAIGMGQQVRLTAGGFVASESVEIDFRCCLNDTVVALPAVNADGSGYLDTTITVPTINDGWPTFPALGRITVKSSTVGGNFDSEIFPVGPPGSAGSNDFDGDGVPDFCDNCPIDVNPGQSDVDDDGLGDTRLGEAGCDPCTNDHSNDADGDLLCETSIGSCPNDPNNDEDDDGICGNVDNCPTVQNPFQADTDGNGIGDACQSAPTCADGFDNDDDGFADFPADPGCSDASDTTETSPSLECDDGIDNDGDGLVDFNSDGSADPGCGIYISLATKEDPECDNGIDDDGDGFVDSDGDFVGTADPECAGFAFGDDETVPEPGFAASLWLAVVVIAALGRRRPASLLRQCAGDSVF